MSLQAGFSPNFGKSPRMVRKTDCWDPCWGGFGLGVRVLSRGYMETLQGCIGTMWISIRVYKVQG